jgi:hypothetical protein
MKRLVLGVTVALLATRAAAADPVTVEHPTFAWQNLYGAILYAASATAHNGGGTPVHAVKVRLELYDKDGHLVAQREGYNLAAEILEDAPAKLNTVKPIPPGGSDPVRVSIDKGDIGKPFRTAKLVVVEVK